MESYIAAKFGQANVDEYMTTSIRDLIRVSPGATFTPEKNTVYLLVGLEEHGTPRRHHLLLLRKEGSFDKVPDNTYTLINIVVLVLTDIDTLNMLGSEFYKDDPVFIQEAVTMVNAEAAAANFTTGRPVFCFSIRAAL